MDTSLARLRRLPLANGYRRGTGTRRMPRRWFSKAILQVDGEWLFPTKRPNGLLQVLYAGEPQGRGRDIESAKLLGQCRDALAMTVCLPGGAGEHQKLCETHIWLMSDRRNIRIGQSVISPLNIEEIVISHGLVIVPHVNRIDHWVLTSNDREGCSRDAKVWLKGDFAARDVGDGPKNIDQRVARVKPAVVKADEKLCTVRPNCEGRLPLIVGPRVVIDPHWRTPSCAGVRGLRKKDIRPVRTRPLVIEYSVDIAVDRIDCGLRERIRAEAAT